MNGMMMSVLPHSGESSNRLPNDTYCGAVVGTMPSDFCVSVMSRITFGAKRVMS